MSRLERMPTSDKLYRLYEKAVQSPKVHIDWVVGIYKDLRNEYPFHLREDFCGTFQLSCEWVKRNRQNTAIGLDLDREPISYGKRTHFIKLEPSQKKRIKILQQNAISVTRPKADVILVGNFSFFILKKRDLLIRYFEKARQSLAPGGLFLLEMAGGPGMIQKMTERRTVAPRTKDKFVYVWDQKSFDPIQRDAKYSIHFHMPDGKKYKDAFTYDWRLWTIPEIRDALAEAGFKKSVVYWETSYRGEGTGEFLVSEEGDNAYSWIAYVVGMADPKPGSKPPKLPKRP
jgi:SAM-dependent methyltransferase